MRGSFIVATEPLAARRRCFFPSWSAAATAAAGERSASLQEALDAFSMVRRSIDHGSENLYGVARGLLSLGKEGVEVQMG